MSTTHRAQKGIHEAIQVVGGHEAAALEHAHGELGDDGQVGAQHLGELGAEALVVVEGLDLAHAAEQVEGVVVQLVDVVDVRVRHHRVREALHVPQPVRDPRRQLRPHVVRRADQPRLRQRPPEHHQLPQADRPRFFGYPAVFYPSR